MPQPIPQDDLAAWCRRWLGSSPVEILFESGYLSAVVGVRLADGRVVVVKAREPAARLAACIQVQRHLYAAGFPCPEPLAGPAPLGTLLATAEEYRPGGEPHAPTPEAPRLYAEALAAAVALAPPVAALPTLEPPPSWVFWDHDQPGIWPVPDERRVDLNAQPGPAWLDSAAQRVRQRLARCDLPPVAGHVDWYPGNLRWRGQQLHVAHDWDSIAARPEAAIAGIAAACFLATMSYAPTVAETATFLEAYARARGRSWSADEREICWAAGLWLRAYDTKIELVIHADHALLARLADEADERLRLAGA
jgi:hypothetical protein